MNTWLQVYAAILASRLMVEEIVDTVVTQAKEPLYIFSSKSLKLLMELEIRFYEYQSHSHFWSEQILNCIQNLCKNQREDKKKCPQQSKN